MATFRSGAYQLSSSEEGLVRALLELMSGGDVADFNWSFAEEAPYDALIVDAVSLDAFSPLQHGDVAAVLMLADTKVSRLAAPSTLFCPIRAEQLRAWLLQKHRNLAQGRGNRPLQQRERSRPTRLRRSQTMVIVSNCAAGRQPLCCRGTNAGSAWQRCYPSAR